MKQKNKQDKHLRQKVEILKAQLSSSKTVYIPEVKPLPKATAQKQSVDYALKTDTKLVKRDLFKTLMISLLAFSIITAIKLSQ